MVYRVYRIAHFPGRPGLESPLVTVTDLGRADKAPQFAVNHVIQHVREIVVDPQG